MKAVVLYESLYGNTAAVAKSIAEGLRPIGKVVLVPFAEAADGVADGAHLLVVGGPTHGWGMTRPGSRQRPSTKGYAVGAREWLQGLIPGQGTRAAVFDTRFDKPRWLTGSAAVRIARQLERRGYRLVVPPDSFFVQHTEGPLREGRGGPGATLGSGASGGVTGS